MLSVILTLQAVEEVLHKSLPTSECRSVACSNKHTTKLMSLLLSVCLENCLILQPPFQLL